MTSTNTNPNLQVPAPCLEEPPPPPVPPPPPPPRKKPLNCVQCSRLLKDSPARRSGPQGPGTLCNACGLRIIKRKRAARGAVKKSTRRARANRSTKKRQSQPQTNTSPQPSLHPNLHHTASASASTDVPVAPPTSLQNPVQPPLFQVTPLQSPPTASSDRTTVTQPAPVINPANVDIIQPNTVPHTSVNPTHNPVPCSGPLHAHTPTSVQDQTIAPSVRQTHSNADPIPLQLSPGVAPKDEHAFSPLSDHYTDAESDSAERMLNALQIGVPTDNGAQPPDNRIDQPNFPPHVFGRCDSAGTTSTQLDLVEVLEGMEVSSEQMPPGNGMIPVEGPYDDNGTVDPMPMPMGSMPMTTPPVSMAPATFSGMMPVQSSPMPTLVMQPGDITKCVDSLAALDQMNSHITHSVSGMDDRIATLTRKHAALTQARNEVILSIAQLMKEKDFAAKKQRQVCDDIARTTCLLHYFQKQEPFPTGA